jgi:hypothetical protein
MARHKANASQTANARLPMRFARVVGVMRRETGQVRALTETWVRPALTLARAVALTCRATQRIAARAARRARAAKSARVALARRVARAVSSRAQAHAKKWRTIRPTAVRAAQRAIRAAENFARAVTAAAARWLIAWARAGQPRAIRPIAARAATRVQPDNTAKRAHA